MDVVVVCPFGPSRDELDGANKVIFSSSVILDEPDFARHPRYDHLPAYLHPAQQKAVIKGTMDVLHSCSISRSLSPIHRLSFASASLIPPKIWRHFETGVPKDAWAAVRVAYIFS